MKNSGIRAEGGKIFVLLLLAVAAVAAGLTWWHYQQNNPSTSAAILFLPEPFAPPESCNPPDSQPQPEAPAADPGLTARLLAQAETEARLLGESLEAARQAIEEAVVMVQEQKENFDFAHDRYEKLMPLVETGALEPLAASQIQSAYISARAGLAQAKYFLAQARRDFGSEESRRWRIDAARQKVVELRQQRSAEQQALEPDPGDNGPPTDWPEEPEILRPWVEAVFRLADNHQVVPGLRARITLPGKTKRLAARVEWVEKTQWPDGRTLWLVRLELENGDLQLPANLRQIPCQVTIDTTLPPTPGAFPGALRRGCLNTQILAGTPLWKNSQSGWTNGRNGPKFAVDESRVERILRACSWLMRAIGDRQLWVKRWCCFEEFHCGGWTG